MRYVALLLLVACGSSEKAAPTLPPIEPRASTAGAALLGYLPPGADVVAELDLARLRANATIGPVLARLDDFVMNGVRLGDVELIVAAAYRVGRDDPGTLIILRGNVGDELAPRTKAIAPDNLRPATGSGKSMASDAAFLRLRELAMPAKAAGATLRVTAKLDARARINAAGRLALDEVPATLSLWLDVADDLAAVALLGDDSSKAAARTVAAVGEARKRVQGFVPAWLVKPLEGLRAEQHGAATRVVSIVNPRALAATLKQLEGT